MIGPQEIINKAAAFREYTSLSGNPMSEYLANIAASEPAKSKLIQRGRLLARYVTLGPKLPSVILV